MVGCWKDKRGNVGTVIRGRKIEVLSEATFLLACVVALIAKEGNLPVDKVVEMSRKAADLVCEHAIEMMNSPDNEEKKMGEMIPFAGRDIQ